MHKGWLFVVVLSGCGVEAERQAPDRLTEAPSDDVRAPKERSCDPLLRGRRIETGVETDLAIDGAGFFPLRDGDRLLLTRDGAFTVDFEGRLVSRDGFPLQVFHPREPQLQDLELGPSRVPPGPTRFISIAGNLDPLASIMRFDPHQPWLTSNESAFVSIYDSLGISYDVGVYFNRTGTGAWDFHAIVEDSAQLLGGTPGMPAAIAEGTLVFDSQARLERVTQRSDFQPLGSAEPQPLRFSFGDELSLGGEGTSGLLQFAFGNRGEITRIEQDGRLGGELTRIQLMRNGVAIGHYSNDTSQKLAQLVLARVSSPTLLRHVGGALFEPVGTPGPVLAKPGTGLYGTIRAGSIERPCE